MLQVKLFRAEKLVSGLAGEKERWEASIINLEEGTRKLPGDCLIAAAFLSYAGPFATEYRDEIVNQVWMAEVFFFSCIYLYSFLSSKVHCRLACGFGYFSHSIRDPNSHGGPTKMTHLSYLE